MASIRYNRRNCFSIPHAMGELVLFPGVNLNVDDQLWKKLKVHPVVSLMIQSGEIDELSKGVDTSLDIAGIPVVDNPKMDGEPVPVMPVKDRSAAAKAAKAKPKEDGSKE